MMESLLKNLKKQVTCSICLETYTKPKTIACLHTFCCECLEKHALDSQRQGKYRCPECQTEVALPEGNRFDNLPTSFLHNSLLSLLAVRQSGDGSQINCGICNKESAEISYCFRCQKLMCPDCVNAHEVFQAAAFEGHKVTPVRHFQAQDYEALLKRKSFCSQQYHEREVTRFFCLECRTCICQICINANHKNHNIDPLEKAADAEKTNIMAGVELLKQKRKVYTDLMREIEGTTSKLEANITKAIGDVSQAANQMIDKIRELERKAITELRNTGMSRGEKLDCVNKQTLPLTKQIDQAVEFANNLAQRSSSSDIMESNRNLEQRFEDLNKTAVPALPVSSFVKFVSTVAPESLSLGFMATSKIDVHRSTVQRITENFQAGLEAEFLVCPKISKEELTSETRPKVHVEVSVEPAEQEGTLIICEKEDGNFQVKFIPKVPGTYDITVKINGDTLASSPFIVQVKERQLENVGELELKGEMPQKPVGIAVNVDERVVRNETMKFEAEHEECVRVLPYQLKNGDVEIHLYVYGDKSGIPTKLKKAAQTFFGQYGWKLKWEDLYNDAFNVLKVTSFEYSSGKPKRLEAYQVDEIEETINNHLHIFSNHRNVTAVQPFFKVTKSIQTEEACIMVYVLGKGQIPMGEEAIPPAIGPYRVDIVNGFCVRTKDPYMPIEAHKQTDFLRLGASIGVYGKQSSGTLGAIVEDEKSGTLYALSCDHVMHDADESKIIHPGFDVYLNCLRFNLSGYKDWINRNTGRDLQLPAISDDSTDEAELQNIFDELREMHVDREGCSNSAKEQITIFERNLEEAFGKRPRVIASYSAGVRRNVCSEMSDREHFIDAAISELDENEVKNVKAEKVLQICDTKHYPSGNCILATPKETMNVEEVFKSGSATGFTESRLILGSSQSLPTFIKDFRRNGDCAWIDVDCINCKQRRTAQTQVQERTDPCEQCQEHSGWLKSCLSIQQHGSKPFCDKGDSGAVIFEKRRKENRNEYQLPSDGFGIIFAELPTQIGVFAIASPLETALKALSQKVSESRPDSEPCQLRLASSFR